MNVEVLGDDVEVGYPDPGKFVGALQKSATAYQAQVYANTRNPVSNSIDVSSYPARMSAKTVLRERTRMINAGTQGSPEAIAPYTRFGDDISYGGGIDWSGIGTGIMDFVKSDTGKTVIGTSVQIIGARMTPTDKARINDVQQQYGLPGYTTGQQNVSVPAPAEDPFKKNLPLIIIGGTVLLAGMFMIATKKPRA